MFKGVTKAYFVLLAVVLAASFCFVSADTAFANWPIVFNVQGATAGDVSNGKQKITISGTFANATRNEYFSRVNNMTVEITGYFRGMQETYTRKVNVSWNFSPVLGPGDRKRLNINLTRQVNRNRGMHPYDRVKVRIKNISFRRAS